VAIADETCFPIIDCRGITMRGQVSFCLLGMAVVLLACVALPCCANDHHSAQHAACTQLYDRDRVRLEGRLNDLQHWELVLLAADLMEAACGGGAAISSANSGRMAFMEGRSHHAAMGVGIKAASALIPLDATHVVGTASAAVPDVSDAEYQALLDIYRNNCGAACQQSGCFPANVSRPVCWRGDWSFFNFVCNAATGGLIQLGLGFCELSGTIPSSLSALTNLQQLYLNSNQLNDTIPSFLSALTHLQLLDLGNNQLNDTIPSFLSALTHLQYLWLYNNHLNGTLPASLDNLSNLEIWYDIGCFAWLFCP
jgi:hypothetical protein